MAEAFTPQSSEINLFSDQNFTCADFRKYCRAKELGRGARSGGRTPTMSDITQTISFIKRGDPQAAERLLPLVYDELRKLAARKLAQEQPGQTIQATALVHEVYLRLVGGDPDRRWDGRGHFFGAAAEAMRRILVENARCKGRQKRGGGLH